MLPNPTTNPAKSCKILPNPAKSYQILQNLAKSGLRYGLCQILPNPSKSYQILQNPALPNPAKSRACICEQAWGKHKLRKWTTMNNNIPIKQRAQQHWKNKKQSKAQQNITICAYTTQSWTNMTWHTSGSEANAFTKSEDNETNSKTCAPTKAHLGVMFCSTTNNIKLNRRGDNSLHDSTLPM